MKRGIFIVLAAATVMAMPAGARVRAYGPTRADVVAALNRHGDAVQRVTDLACWVHNDAGRRSAECRFTAHNGPRREAHVATFLYVDGWRLLDDRAH